MATNLQTNTVQTLIHYVKDITGLDNASDARIVRALNFGADNYSYIAVTSSGRWRFDSPNQDNLPRITSSIGQSDTKISLPNDLIAIELVEIEVDGKYQLVHPTDIRENSEESLSTIYSSEGIPKVYDYDSRYIYIYPVSDTSRTVRITYSRAHPRFSTSNLTQSVGTLPLHEEYIAMYAADRLMIGTNDEMRNNIRKELEVMQGEIRDLFSKRDQDTPQRIKGKVPNAFTSRSRGRR